MLKKYFSIIFIICLFILAGFWLFKYSFQPERVQSASGDNVSGWAWSETVGWISFNGSNYGVNVDINNGKFSGYAWSENIGWISFNESDTGAPPSNDPCPDPSCIAKATPSGQLGKSNVPIYGWARALAYGGGWDGWIRFDHGRADKVYIDTNGEFHGWAWGSDVVGWISFNCVDRGVCGSSNYKVLVNINSPPSVTCNNIGACQNPPWNCCSDSRHPILTWTFNDSDGDTQASYQVQIDVEGSSDFIPTVKLDHTASTDSTSYTVSTAHMVVPGDDMQWGQTYSWRVRVQDSRGSWSSAWATCTVVMPSHAYPDPDFSYSPKKPSALEPVQFTDETEFHDGANSWSWTFENAVPASSVLQNPVATFSSSGNWDVTLEATDSDGFMCPITKTINVSKPLPEWREIKPR